jgi:hypothetical protein
MSRPELSEPRRLRGEGQRRLRNDLEGVAMSVLPDGHCNHSSGRRRRRVTMRDRRCSAKFNSLRGNSGKRSSVRVTSVPAFYP